MKIECNLAEEVGFEPTDPLRSTVFKTAAFDRSAILPYLLKHGYYIRLLKKNQVFFENFLKIFLFSI